MGVPVLAGAAGKKAATALVLGGTVATYVMLPLAIIELWRAQQTAEAAEPGRAR